MASQPIVSASVPYEVVAELDSIAQKRGTTRSVVVKQLLVFALNQYQRHQTQFVEKNV